MQDFLRRDGRAIAQPAFRILAWLDGSLNDPANAAMGEASLRAFLRYHRDDVGLIAIADKLRQPNPVFPDDAAINDAIQWLHTPDKVFAATLRMNGDSNVELGYPAVPHFRIDEDVGLVMLEMSLPIDSTRNVNIADAVTQILATAPLRAAVMGLGLYQPSRLSSLITYMPRAFQRYRCALEVQLTGPRDGIRKDRSAFDYAKNTHVQPGLPDIGWRSLIGAPFAARLPKGQPEHAHVDITRTDNDVTVLTAGPLPIWGDVNEGEDTSAYSAVAQWLETLRYPVPIALNSLFGSQGADPRGADRVEAYVRRHDLALDISRFDKAVSPQ